MPTVNASKSEYADAIGLMGRMGWSNSKVLLWIGEISRKSRRSLRRCQMFVTGFE